MKKFINTYFSFSKGELIGIAVLALIIFLLWCTKWYLKNFQSSESNLKFIQEQIDSFLYVAANNQADTSSSRYQYKNYQNKNYQNYSYNKKKKDHEQDDYDYSKSKNRVYNLQNFDPNTSSEEELLDIGLPKYIVNNIIKYRTIGAKFYNKEDMKKIYGMNDMIYEKIENYIQITPIASSPKNYANYQNTYPSNSPTKTYTPKAPIFVDINKSDTSEWIALPMIGSKLANRIVKYRESLGGFISLEQVREVYGLSDSTWTIILPKLKFENKEINKININTIDLETLKKHPYAKKLAKVLINYRTQHGPFQNLDDVLKIKIITQDEFNKLKPYLSL